MIERCRNCANFEAISDTVGYCTFMAVMIEKGVVILDSHSILRIVRDKQEQEIINFIIVQSEFGCVYYKKMVVH